MRPRVPGNYIHIQSVRTSTVSEAIGHPSLGHPNKLKFSVLVHKAHTTPWQAREGTYTSHTHVGKGAPLMRERTGTNFSPKGRMKGTPLRRDAPDSTG